MRLRDFYATCTQTYVRKFIYADMYTDTNFALGFFPRHSRGLYEDTGRECIQAYVRTFVHAHIHIRASYIN
jgi:hypothetical protein